MLRNPAGQRNDLVTYLLDRHRQADFDTDYLVAFADYPPALCRVSEGRAVEQHGTSWIGDHRAFGKFQETYNSEMPQVDADAWQVWVSKMNNSMTAVINDPGIPSVAGFLVTVTSRSIERDGFRYLARSGGEGFLPVALTNEPTSLIRPVGAAGGGFRYSLLVPDGPGIPAIGVYIPEGPVGVLFSVTTTQVRAATIQDFMARVHDEFRITLDGPHWG